MTKDGRSTTLILPATPAAIPARPRQACLLGVGGSVLGQRVEIGASLTMGRDPSCRLISSDPGVSGRHATFRVDGEKALVEDLGSTNGTIVNGERIEAPRVLQNDDLIQVGGELLRFRWSDDLETALYEQLVREATRDPLTGLCNRRHFFSELERDVARAVRGRRPLSVLFADLDRFKAINDEHGHTAGDEVLRETARRLDAAIRTTDLVARYGGEEFVVLLPDTMLADAVQVAERIRQLVREAPHRTSGAMLDVTVSIGVAELAETQPPDRVEDAQEQQRIVTTLLNLADRRLYEAKNAGRDRVRGWG